MAEKRYLDDLVMRDARIFLKDFSGVKFGDGKRKFGLMLPAELAEQMAKDGWNVKQFDPQDPDEEPTYFINVNVSYKLVEPTIKLISNGNMVAIHEDTVGRLDAVKIAKADVVVHPNWYCMGKGKSEKCGFTAYLNELYVTTRSSALADEYEKMYGGNVSDNVDEELPF